MLQAGSALPQHAGKMPSSQVQASHFQIKAQLLQGCMCNTPEEIRFHSSLWTTPYPRLTAIRIGAALQEAGKSWQGCIRRTALHVVVKPRRARCLRPWMSVLLQVPYCWSGSLRTQAGVLASCTCKPGPSLRSAVPSTPCAKQSSPCMGAFATCKDHHLPPLCPQATVPSGSAPCWCTRSTGQRSLARLHLQLPPDGPNHMPGCRSTWLPPYSSQAQGHPAREQPIAQLWDLLNSVQWLQRTIASGRLHAHPGLQAGLEGPQDGVRLETQPRPMPHSLCRQQSAVCCKAGKHWQDFLCKVHGLAT